MQLARKYMRISLIGLIPFTFSSALSSALRDTGETVTPMIASVVAIASNTILNFLLIFGHLGLPRLGVAGAAIATVIARFLEAGVLLWRTRPGGCRPEFLVGAHRSLRIPGSTARKIFLTGTPLMISDSLWAVGTTLVNQCYSQRGLDAVSANSICNTVYQIFAIFMIAMGSAMAILIGQRLGAGEKAQARREAGQLMTLNFLVHIGLAVATLAFAVVIPRMYNLSSSARVLTAWMLVSLSCILPFDATNHASYCIMRSGGKMLITFLYDFCFAWGGSLLVAFCLIRFTALPMALVYAAVNAVQVFKFVAGILIIRSGIWCNTLAG
jgi:putative MATE family efflux protein